MSTSTARRVIVAAAAAVLTGLALGSTPASAGVSDTVEIETALFYGNDEHALFTGPPFDEGCSKQAFLSFPGRAVETPSGIYSDHAAGENQAFLYDLEAEGVSSAFELLLQACAAVEAGDSPPVPVAQGTTTDRQSSWSGFERSRLQHSSVGTLETPDGQEVKVHGLFRASFSHPDDGPPQVIQEFEKLTVTPLG